MDNSTDQETKKSTIVPGKAQDIFGCWNNKATIQPNDTSTTIIKKIFIRIIGIILLILFSPILLAIFVTVIAVTL